MGKRRMSREAALGVLGVGRDAPPEDVRRAYHRKALASHPDKGGSAAAFQQVKEAFEVAKRPAVAPAVAAARHCVHVGLTLHGSDGGANSVILSDGLANFGNAGDDATFLVAATAGRGAIHAQAPRCSARATSRKLPRTRDAGARGARGRACASGCIRGEGMK